jgi:hypothetical protein
MTLKRKITPFLLCFLFTQAIAQDPNLVSNLEVWLDGTTGVETAAGIAAKNGESVTNWIDKKSGKIFTQSVQAKKPAYSFVNDKKVIQFNSAEFDGLMYSSDFIGNNEFTYFVVASASSFTGALVGTGHSDLYLWHGDVLGRVWNGSYKVASYNEKIATQQFFIASVSWSNSTAIVSLNGKRNSTPVAGLTAGRNSFLIGSNPSSEILNFNGSIAEIVIYKKALTESELMVVEEYLAIKYGITLPGEGGGVSCPHIYCGETGVGIGTSKIPADYKLAVRGNVMAERVKVEVYSKWPDYVFEKDYKLIELSQLREFISTNGHLPNIPSAENATKIGIDLGEMDVRLLEKIEELTLYILELEQRLKKLEKSEMK